MKKIIFIVLFISLIAKSNAQGDVKISDLNIPTSPAFVFLDKSPASIEKPSSPKALSISLINIWKESGAIEFTPYWLKNRPAYTFEDDLKNKNPIFQTLAFSLASVKEDSISYLSGGFRTQVAKSYSKDIIDKILAKKKEIVDALVETDDEGNPKIDEDKIKELKKELNNLKSNTNWILEFAGAYAGNSSKNSNISATKSGLWAHLKWTPNGSLIDFVGLARYRWTIGDATKTISDSTFFDYGINISHQGTDFDIQLEYVNRRDYAAKANYDRLVFVANYQISQGIVAVASFGKNFTKVNNVFTSLGVKFGFSNEKLKL